MLRGTVVVLALLCASPVAAQRAAPEGGTTLETLADLHRACRDADAGSAPKLYSIDLPPGTFRFDRYDPADDVLPVDTRRNLLALGGRASLLPSNLETIGFVVSPAEARELAAVLGVATLRIGFFLGFDEPARTHCLIRPAVGVTAVRMDVAFAELLGQRGETLAREDGDRLAAWLDDLARDRVEGTGPRGAIGQASFGPPLADSEPHQHALDAASRGAVGTAIARCHADGVARGAQSRGHVAVRLQVDGPTGRVRASEVELSTLGDDREAECIARASSNVTFPAGPPGTLAVSVPIRLAAD